MAVVNSRTSSRNEQKSRMQRRYSLLLKKKTLSVLFVLLVGCCYWQMCLQQSIQNSTQRADNEHQQTISSSLLLLKRATIGEEPHDVTSSSVTSSSSTRSPNQIVHKTTRRSQQFVKFNKRGRKVMKEITSVEISDLKDLANDDSTAAGLEGKEKVVALLLRAGILKMDVETIARLPTWKAISDLYYNGNQQHHKPIVHGLDHSCRDFTNHVPRDDAYLAPAGLFNSGTNALTYYLRANLYMSHNTADPGHFSGILTQVPWHKHWLSRLRYNNTIPRHEQFNKDHVLPIVIIRDPLSWAQSMCQHPYDVKWLLSSSPHHTHDATTTTNKQQHYCPNFVTNNGKQVPVQIPAMTNKNEEIITTWPSLLHLWKDWYHDYLTSSQPFLMIRHEDLLFHPEEVIAVIQECAGATRLGNNNHSFTYVMDAAKWEHAKIYGPQSNRISAMIKHGNAARRIRNMTRADLEYAKAVLDDDDDNDDSAVDNNMMDNEQPQRPRHRRRRNLLRLFQYTLPEPTSLDTPP